MISSEDVRRVTFDKAFQGYRREDVDAYLKEVAQAVDDLAAQNDDLQKKLVVLPSVLTSTVPRKTPCARR